MFDISWGELFVITGAGLVLIGKRDLPKASNVVGTQIGRIVGFLQGARARADRFASQSELRQLHNELKMGLRELDAVKSELAISISPSSMVSRTLGATTANVALSSSQQQQRPQQDFISPKQGISNASSKFPLNYNMTQTDPMMITNTSSAVVNPNLDTTLSANNETTTSEFQQQSSNNKIVDSNMHETMIAAVAEQEWGTQGIAFTSTAEQGDGTYNKDVVGSVILAKHIQQSLIFDQYDRVVAEQDMALQNKITDIQTRIQTEKHNNKNGNKNNTNDYNSK